MASPFSVFRKNQKLMMAVLCIVAMFGFVIGDAIFSGRRGGGADGPHDDVVATTKYFDIHKSMLDRAVFHRSIVRRFVIEAERETVAREFEREARQQMQGERNEEAIKRQVEFRLQMILPQLLEFVDLRVGSMDERSIVESLIFAEQARRLGIQGSDKRVQEFINDVVQNQMTPEQLNAVFERIRGAGDRGPQITGSQLYDAFRTEMLAADIRKWFIGGPARATTPLDRWHYYLRKNCFASAEVLAVDVKSMLGQVPEPSESEIAAMFDKYKYDLPEPGSPEPGFKLPQQAAFQYVSVSEAAYFDPDKLSADEVAEYYAKNIGRYPYTPDSLEAREPLRVTPDSDFALEKDAGPANPAQAAGGNNAATSAATPTPPAKPSPSPTGSPSATKKEGSCDPAEEPNGESLNSDALNHNDLLNDDDGASSDCQPAASASASGDAAPKAPPGATSTGTTSTSNRSATAPKPTATSTATAPSTTGAPGGTAAPAAPAPALGNPAGTPGSSTAAPSASPSATSTGSATAAASASPVAVPQPPPQLPSEDVLLPLDIKSGKTPAHDPLWKVEKKVRTELARSKATEKVAEILKAMKEEMNDAATNRRDVEGDTPVFTPEQWKELAEKHGLKGDTTPLLSELEVRQLLEEPGLFHAEVRSSQFNFQEQPRRVGVAAFESAGVYSPQDAIEIPVASDFSAESQGARETIHYLYWKTKHVNARVPELKEQATHEAVVIACKMPAARDLARKRADELAAKGRQAGQSLAKTLGESDVRKTGTFTWFEPDLSGDFRQRMEQTPLKLTERVNGVDDPGAEFFRTAFGLEESEIGTAMNNPQTACYVIRLLQLAPPPKQLEAQFLLDHYQNYERYGRRDVQQEEAPETNAALLADAELKWLREPIEDRGR